MVTLGPLVYTGKEVNQKAELHSQGSVSVMLSSLLPRGHADVSYSYQGILSKILDHLLVAAVPSMQAAYTQQSYFMEEIQGMALPQSTQRFHLIQMR